MTRVGASLLVLALGGCRAILGIDDPHVISDGAVDSPGQDALRIDAPPSDADTCFGSELVVCLSSLPTNTVTISGAVDTTQALVCTTTISLPDGEQACVVSGADVVIQASRITGTRALVVVATGSIDVQGFVDGHTENGSKGAGAPSKACLPNVPVAAFAAGAGGGGGGSFGELGGSGGSGDAGSGPGGPAVGAGSAGLHAGCNGTNGGAGTGGAATGGPGGGMLYLIAGTSITIETSASIRVGGGGGAGGASFGGGGGGGTGGFIGLEAPTIDVAGFLYAGGGGGGAGASGATTGSAGVDADVSLHTAGGTAGSAGGVGGAGDPALGATLGPGAGPGKAGGGGGGGGGAPGIIFAKGRVAMAADGSAIPPIAGAIGN